MTGTTALNGKNGSCWTATAGPTSYSPLEGSIHAETVVVGAGIVGLTTALRLCEAGRSVIVLEALRVGRQVTGRSTAKITTQHGLIYHDLMRNLGQPTAQSYADANRAGVRQILDWAAAHAIDCDLETRAAYTYTADPARRGEIEAEANAARQLGLDAEVLDRAPLPFSTAGALRFPDQAQFNPARYAIGLARAVEKLGGRIFELSRAVSIDEASRWRVVTDNGTAHAENMVVATNMTVKSPVGMANRTQPRSHPVMAFRIDDPTRLDGMFLGIDNPTRSIRTGRDDAGPLLVVLGPKFNTGQDADVARRFVELESWARANLPVGAAAWRWCNEDYDTPDRLPYVGEPDPDKSPGFHIATGFNAWGISNGTAAGILISDRILGQSCPWEKLYDPARPYDKEFHINGQSQSIVGSFDEIGPGEGGVLVSGEKKIAAWRDETGELHTVSATCTHKGCTVSWNNADRTWDCPCHGSIFAADGSVIHGPARKALPPASL
ncbi:FAD-dependent oxidoreductase [Mesorhizobium sp. BAC0120]|uniref:FAD-dependent oxidoreductase n=1 Tax=Mesorhizobium sp. BAC0120 TaxID=3090670 RepID=UPI00298C9592|nr:FAD-dependent oxidoreductase [Mesorhizobium sp. BAC0120]MDW6023621.1 FAD-dependent oxidoreductase [Mesorhizobium sp. BAC0120]